MNLSRCPNCQATPFKQFLPKMVARRRYRWIFWGRWPEYSVICEDCQEIVAHETEADAREALAKEFKEDGE